MNAERPWSTLAQRIKDANITPEQVQVIWIKHADTRPSPDPPPLAYAKELQGWLASIVRTLRTKHPNLRIIYLSSRTYGGYHETGNPEPFAYESAFSVRWLIQEQIKGDAKLNFDPKKGNVVAPVLLWGPYLWADGVMPRKCDNLTWQRSDYSKDGVHPNDKGRQKVADQLLRFFKENAGSRTWFVKK